MFWRLTTFLYLSLLTIYLPSAKGTTLVPSTQTLKTILEKNNVPFRALDGKIEIPAHIEHVKLDIGLSYNAPMSQHWLSHEKDLVVFGFEPNPAAIASILQGAIKRDAIHGNPLEKKFIGTNFFLIPCALGLSTNTTAKFFVTTGDCGRSSLYAPKQIGVECVINVPLFSLKDFFDLFPFDSHPIIDYIKIDAQGADLDIVKSAEDYLEERVVYITIEPDDSHYEKTVNAEADIDNYMKSRGFLRHASPHTSDPTYFNPRYSEYIKNHTVHIYQKG